MSAQPEQWLGMNIFRCAYGSYSVRFPCGRVRFGTMREIKQDVQDYLAGALPPAKRGWA